MHGWEVTLKCQTAIALRERMARQTSCVWTCHYKAECCMCQWRWGDADERLLRACVNQTLQLEQTTHIRGVALVRPRTSGTLSLWSGRLSVTNASNVRKCRCDKLYFPVIRNIAHYQSLQASVCDSLEGEKMGPQRTNSFSQALAF